jgi:uncharacterized membrane protein YcaP (DUF421 family)
MDWSMVFSGWQPIVRTLFIGVLAYVSLVAFLRISGKRTLSKMNAFDFIVTIALGSTLAAALVDQNVDLAQAVLALGLLVLLQYLIASASVRYPKFQELIKSEPALLVSNGRLLDQALKRERVTREEILAAIRAEGHGSIEEIGAVVLETDGNFSVLKSANVGEDSALETVRHGEASAR